MFSNLAWSFLAGMLLAGAFCDQISLGQTDNDSAKIVNRRVLASKRNSGPEIAEPSNNFTPKNTSSIAPRKGKSPLGASAVASAERPESGSPTTSRSNRQTINAQSASFFKKTPTGLNLDLGSRSFGLYPDEGVPNPVLGDNRLVTTGESGDKPAGDTAEDNGGAEDENEESTGADEGDALEPWTLFQLPRLEQHDIHVHGWLAQGFTWNPDDPQDRSNGILGMNDRANDYLFNQLGLTVEKPVTEEPCDWSVGWRVGLMYGADARFVQAFGFDEGWNSGRFVALAIPELFADVFVPWGQGASLRLGRFWSPIGYEGVPALDRFFHSATNAFMLAEPSTHTGALLKYPLTEQWTIQGGIVQGWDVWQDNNHSWGALGTLGWISQDERTTVTGVFYNGDETVDVDDNQFTYSLMLTHEFTDRWSYLFWHDFNAARDVAFTPAGELKNGQWFAFNNAIFYAVDDQVSLGCRFEYYRDDDGVTIFQPITGDNLGPGDLFGLTWGVNYTPTTNLLIRPEIRWDWANRAIPYDDQTDRQQFTGSCDVVWQF